MRFGSRIVGHDGVIRHGKENRKQRRMLARTDCCAGAQRGVREAVLWATADYGTVLLLLAEQDPEIRLQGGGIEITDCGTVSEPDLFLLHSRLADLLDDDDQPFLTGSAAHHGSH